MLDEPDFGDGATMLESLLKAKGAILLVFFLFVFKRCGKGQAGRVINANMAYKRTDRIVEGNVSTQEN